MATLTVGAGETFSTLSAAIAASHDGDVIKVAGGTYTNDFATINTKIRIEGVGDMVHLVATVPPPDGKAILTINTDVTLVNIEFSGAAVADGNGAGIRYQGGNLVLDHCYFHDNQDGMLAGDDPAGSITITDSEFAHNGADDGFTHDLYVNKVGTLQITGSYFHDAVGGHEIKSRALNTIIENNRIANGLTGDGSFDIDLPNGGNATVENNVIEKGPDAPNHTMISFGEEGGVYPGSTLSVTGNTLLNDASGSTVLVRDVSGGSVSITNNQGFAISGAQLYTGTGTPTISGNTSLASEPAFDTSHPFLPVEPVTFAACFAGGTRILGADGEIAVERLRPGDRIVTLVRGDRGVRPVRWIGRRRIDLTVHPRPETVRPVRIVRGAIAENVPRRDLLLSPDHALFLDGVLICMGQLINGMTIRRETAARTVDYFHVEMDRHAILYAEGLEAESYLDTGNRGFFANSGAPLILHPDLAGPDLAGEGSEQRLSGSCAPFRVDETTVRPVWQRLVERAAELGYKDAAPPTTEEPELQLLARDRLVRPTATARGRHVFILPDGLSEVRLRSRAARPTVCRPWLDDSRELGVSVGRIVLRGGENIVEVPLDHPGLTDGWWAVESEGNVPTRWTNGDARLPLPPMRSPMSLEIQLTGAMIYPRIERNPGADIEQRKRA